MKIALFEAMDKSKIGSAIFPLGLGYLASYVRKHRPEHEIVVFRNSDELIDFSPDLTGISCMSSGFEYALRDASLIKRYVESPLILGGAHISSIPEILPDSFDAGVVGEGEETFLEIVDLIEKKKNPTPSDYGDLKGLVIHDGNGKAVLTEPRPLIEDVDSIPFPSRDWKRSISSRWSFTSRGCPYRCAFCFSALFWNRCRMNSASYVVDELMELWREKVPGDHTFIDDLFSARLDRVREIGVMLKEKVNRRVRFTATARANLVNDEMTKTLSDFGVEYVHLGLESGSDPVLTYLKREKCSVEQNQRALDLLTERGIKCIGTFIIGASVEEEEDIKKTLFFIEKNLKDRKLAAFSFAPLIPFPGTIVWEEAVSKGKIDPHNFDWGSLDIDLQNFDRERYVYVNEKMKQERFYYWFDRINELMRYE